MNDKLQYDPEETRLMKSAGSLHNLRILLETEKVKNEILERQEKYYRVLFIERLGVLEILLQNLPRGQGFLDFIRDVRSYLAEAQIMIDIDVNTYLIKLLDEPLLQREVIDTLLPRLASKYPERAKEFSNAYHGMIEGRNKFDDIFIGAFKTLK